MTRPQPSERHPRKRAVTPPPRLAMKPLAVDDAPLALPSTEAHASWTAQSLLQLQRVAGNRAVQRVAEEGLIQRRLSKAALREITDELNYDPAVIPFRAAARQVFRRLGALRGTDEHVGQVLAEMGYHDLGGLEGLLAAVRRQLSGEVTEAAAIVTDEQRAAGITSTDNEGRKIGPFNGGRGSRDEVGPSKGAVYYDAGRNYCISVDNSSHAGVGTWKLFSKSGGSWQRLDTLHPDGRRMNRG